MTARDDIPPFFDDEPAVAQLRVPPHSANAESSVLGGLLIDGRAWDQVAAILADEDFYRHQNRLVFAAIAALANAQRPADVITVYEHLQRLDKAEKEGVDLAYLNALAQSTPSAANIRRYAEIVKERSTLRKLVAASDQIATAAFNPQNKPVATIVDEAMQQILRVSPDVGEDDWQGFDVCVVEEQNRIDAQRHGAEERSKSFIPTGMTELDEMLDGGLRGGQLVAICARPSMGKSALADTIGVYVASEQRLPVGKFSMEMQNREGAQRAISAAARVPLHALRRPERMSDMHWSAMSAAVERLSTVPFYSTDKGGLNINQARAKARALMRKHGLRLLIVDYFQLMSGTDPKAPRTYQLEEASRGFKTLAKELDVPVILLAQVSRGVEKQDDPMPRMSDIKDCGSLEQDADVILFLHRPIVLKPDLGDEWKFYAKGHLAKQRGGRTGFLDFQFDGQYTRYSSWPNDVPVPKNPVTVKGAGAAKKGNL